MSCFQSPLYPMHRITLLRLIRSGVFLYGSLILVHFLFPDSREQQRRERIAGFIALLWLLPYGLVFSQLPVLFQNDIGNYFIFPSVLFASTVVFLELASHSKKARNPLCSLYTLVLFLLELSGIAYCFYFFITENPWMKLLCCPFWPPLPGKLATISVPFSVCPCWLVSSRDSLPDFCCCFTRLNQAAAVLAFQS